MVLILQSSALLGKLQNAPLGRGHDFLFPVCFQEGWSTVTFTYRLFLSLQVLPSFTPKILLSGIGKNEQSLGRNGVQHVQFWRAEKFRKESMMGTSWYFKSINTGESQVGLALLITDSTVCWDKKWRTQRRWGKSPWFCNIGFICSALAVGDPVHPAALENCL